MLATGNGGAFESLDAGSHWRVLDGTAGLNIDGVAVVDGRPVALVGHEGRLLTQPTGSARWSSDTEIAQAFATIRLTDVFFVDRSHGWATGQQGTMLRSQDGGTHWRQLPMPTGATIWAVRFVDLDHGWAVGNNGAIFETADGGDDWASIHTPITNGVWDLALDRAGGGMAVGMQSLILRGRPGGQLPTLSRFDVGAGVGGLSVTFGIHSGSGRQFIPAGVEFRTSPEGDWRSIATTFRPSDGPDGWKFTWNPKSGAYRLREGTPIYYRIGLRGPGDLVAKLSPASPYSYEPVLARLWNAYPAATSAAAIAILLLLAQLAIVSAVWIVRPRALTRIDGPGLSEELQKIVGDKLWQNKIAAALLRLLLLKRIVASKRVQTAWLEAYRRGEEDLEALGPTALNLYMAGTDLLDAWVERHLETARANLDLLPGAQVPGGYSPLPVCVTREQRRIVEGPSPEGVRPWLSGRRAAAQIVGVGGGGKTTLALQIARWTMGDDGELRPTDHRAIPSILTGCQTSLAAELADRLRSLLDLSGPLDPGLLSRLAAEKRVLVVFDAFTEWPAEEQDRALSELQGAEGLGLNMLLMTAREAVDLPGRRTTFVQPQPIGVTEVVPLIYTLLGQHSAIARVSGRQQLALAERVLAMVEESANDTGVTPLLLTLFVESAVRETESGLALDDLPSSIPETYLAYVRSFEQEPAARRGRRASALVTGGMALAKVALGADFLPGEFAAEHAMHALADAGCDPASILERLRQTGLLSTRAVAGEVLHRFAFDPLAEYLAAVSIVREASRDHQVWSEHLSRLKTVPGYPQAILGYLSSLGNCLAAYRRSLNLPAFEQPWNECA